MKKEKRELTLEQLKKINKILEIIAYVIFSICIVGPFVIVAVEEKLTKLLDECAIVIAMFAFFLIIWAYFVGPYIDIKIRDKEDELKVTKIKNNAKKGNLKNVIVVKNRNIQNEILFNNIEKILFEGKSRDFLVLEIYFKSGFSLPINVREEVVLSVFSERRKEKIFDNIIDSITIEDLEKPTMQVKIDTKGKIITRRVDNRKLLGWFKLKK